MRERMRRDEEFCASRKILNLASDVKKCKLMRGETIQ